MKKELKKQNRAFGEALYDLAKKHRIKLNNQSSIENTLLDAVAPLLFRKNYESWNRLIFKIHQIWKNKFWKILKNLVIILRHILHW